MQGILQGSYFLLIFTWISRRKRSRIYNEGLYSTKEGQKRNAKRCD